MASPAWVSNTDTDFSATASAAANTPATNLGDRLIAIVLTYASRTWGAAPTNWAQLATSGDYVHVYERVNCPSASASTATFTWTGGNTDAIVRVVRISGSHLSDASSISSFGTGNNANPDPPSLNPAASKDWLWLAIAHWSHFFGSDRARTAVPTNYTATTDHDIQPGGGELETSLAYRQLTASSEDPGSFTLDGSAQTWRAVTIAVPPTATQTVSPSGIASAEAFGTAQLNQQIAPSGIASAEAFGTAGLVHVVAPGGIVSAEAFGTPVVNIGTTQTLDVNGQGIASAEAFGTATVAGPILDAGGIASEEAFGTPAITQQVAPSGIGSEEAFGTPTVAGPILDAGGIASEEAFGTPAVTAGIQPSGIASGEAFGTPTVAGPIVDAGGIATGEAFGTPSVSARIATTGISSAEAFGLLALLLKIAPGGIASAEAFGTARLHQEVDPAGGIASAEAFGTARIVLKISPTGIPSEEAFGETTVRLNPAPVAEPVATAAQVADALAGRYGAVQLRFRYSRRTRTNQLVDEIIGIAEPGVVSLDNGRAVVRDFEVTFDLPLMPADFNAKTDLIAPAVEVYVRPVQQWVSIQVGLFVLDAPERLYLEQSTLLPCRGADLTMLLVRARRAAPYTAAAGSNVVNLVRAIFDRHGLRHSFPDSSLTLPHDITWDLANDYLIARQLFDGINYHPPTPDRTGLFTTRPLALPEDETASVTYQDTAEPMMVEARSGYRQSDDVQQPNRVKALIEDVRNADFGFELRENADPASPNSTAALVYGDAVAVASSSADSPTVVTTSSAHGLSTGVTVLISGHAGSTPDINGSYEVTVLTPTTFSIPVAVSAGGSGGTVQPTVVQPFELKADTEPSTKAVIDATRAAALAEYHLAWSALLSERAELSTYLDPRREAREYYEVDLGGIEDRQLYAALGWTFRLAEGEVMTHQLGRADPVAILSPPTA